MRYEATVREWMTPHPISISTDTPLIDAHKIMTENSIRRLPVVDEGRLVGIITLGDIRGAQPSEATSLNIWELNYMLSRMTVERTMTHPVHTISAEAAVAEAAELMLINRIAGLPVLEADELVGIITESDIFRMVVEDWKQPEELEG